MLTIKTAELKVENRIIKDPIRTWQCGCEEGTYTYDYGA
jgi:hypothetical protein